MGWDGMGWDGMGWDGSGRLDGSAVEYALKIVQFCELSGEEGFGVLVRRV